MATPRVRALATKARAPQALRRLIAVAMELERRTMQLYCQYESRFAEPEEVRAFWFDMAEHESRHYGALAMVAGLLECAPQRTLAAAPTVSPAHIERLRRLLTRAETEARGRLTLARALETALAIESSEVEDLVLELLRILKGERERERAVRSLIHDLGDLSYMIEKFSPNRPLLSKADLLIEQRVARLRVAGRGPLVHGDRRNVRRG
jgi:rubrerythrin